MFAEGLSFHAGGFEPAACGFWRQLLCQLSEYGMKKSAPARLGKDAYIIWLLLSHFFIDRTLETNLAGFLPTARRLVVALQAENVIANIGDLEA